MSTKLSRRSLLGYISAAGAAHMIPFPNSLNGLFSKSKETIKLGVIADLHGGLATDASKRLDSFLTEMKHEPCDALVQLGDFAFPNKKNQSFPDRFNGAHNTTLHVLGNHDLDLGLTREDCARAWGMESSYYTKDVGDIRIIILDGNEKGSPDHKGGYPSFIGQKQVQWLEFQLKESAKPILILSHQPLAGAAAVDNAKQIQNLLAKFRSKILLCVNGHTHIDSLVQKQDVSYLHINSASYYWVGGKQRMAYYSDPLFTTITIDPKTQTINIQPKASSWSGDSPKKLGALKKSKTLSEKEVTPQIRPHHISKTELKVLTWNIWGKLNLEPKYVVNRKTARERTIDIVRKSGADVIAMVETYGSAATIAKELGFHYFTPSPDANLCIFSRYPFAETKLYKGLSPFSFIGSTIQMPGGQKVRVLDIWLTSGGRHIVKIKDKSVSDEQFTRGDDLRSDHLTKLLQHKDFQQEIADAERVPVIMAGDFNCVSHLDHNQKTKAKSLNHSRDLSIKVSMAMKKLGFVDSYREVHPIVTEKSLGHTWTTVGKDYQYQSGKGFEPVENHPNPEYQDPYARIDYIYSIGEKIKPISSVVIDRYDKDSKTRFPEFPSDHAAVLSVFRLK